MITEKNMDAMLKKRKRVENILQKVENNIDIILKRFVPLVFAMTFVAGIINWQTGLIIFCAFCGLFAITACLFFIFRFYTKHIPGVLSEAILEYTIKPQLEKSFTDVEYEYRKGVNAEDLKNSKIFQDGLHFDIKGRITGKNNGCPFEILGVKIAKPIDSLSFLTDENGKAHSMFDGTWIILNAKKNIGKNRVVVRNIRSTVDIEHGAIRGGMHRIELESAVFNRNFIVLSDSDTSDAQYLLPPDAMDKLVTFNSRHDDIELSLCYHKNQLHIALNGLKCGALFGEELFFGLWWERFANVLDEALDTVANHNRPDGYVEENCN